ncbi:hypothetical protein Zm00014a_017158 [Zea mays]|uniref:Uncharacterized protein n=2 Tax=Zea mays TaxID=4577 RepID=A0A1D6KPT7_MAIZE|nr:uncharacterized protein LOC103643322 [Zea mays]ONM04810.1 hypothetical protein ZEAMMB73_Zm00001d032306 [Zea mays]PWZ56246.1 hypothetical protein Zm00014a_017158 [Zea mays]|eukprot:XP_008664695.1 uncharacterized protein LOC103643322 [Zea mays]
MAMSLSRFSQWIWPGSRTRNPRGREPPAGSTALTEGLFPDSPSGFRDPDPGSGAAQRRKGKSRRRGGRVEAKVDGEHGMVIVQSDGDGCLSDSDSDGSDWSIGWLEPLAPDLQSDVDSEGSFAVLVRCYRRGRADRPDRPDGKFPAPGGVAHGHGGVSGNKNFVEQ